MIARGTIALFTAVFLYALPCHSIAGELRPFVRGSWQELQRAHAGQPIIAHFWGLTCGPCRVEMPHWGRLLKERPHLDLVLINSDLVANDPATTSAFLAQNGLAAAESWIFADNFVERLRYEIDPQWRGEIPLTLLIARDGTITKLEGAADLARIRAWHDAQSQPTK